MVERFRCRAFAKIFGVEQRQKFRIADEIIPGEDDQARDRFGGIEVFQIETSFLDPDFLIRTFKDREIQVFLVADVIIQHALVGAGLRRDAVDPRAGEAMRGEFLLRSLQNAQPHARGIALPF